MRHGGDGSGTADGEHLAHATAGARAANRISSLAGDGVQSTTSRRQCRSDGLPGDSGIITVEGRGTAPWQCRGPTRRWAGVHSSHKDAGLGLDPHDGCT